MLNTLAIYNELSQFLDDRAARKFAELFGSLYGELSNAVTKADFRELLEQGRRTDERIDRLSEKVGELAEAQRRTDEKVGELAEAQRRTDEKIGELAEAQRRTDEKVGELAEAQRRTDEKIGELAEAQRRTDEKIGELAEAQRKTEARLDVLSVTMNELAEAQKRTDEKVAGMMEAQRRMDNAIARLTEHQLKTDKRLDRTNKQLGGLSMSFGYVLENEAYRYLPALLEKDHGMVVRGQLKRDYLEDRDGNELEVNILGTAVKNGAEYLLVGESKAQLSKRDVDRFIRRRLDRILPPAGTEVFPLLICHMTSSKEAAAYAADKGVALYFSYQFR